MLDIPDKITFLLVDDYPSVRTMVKTQLLNIGHQGKILEASGVDEAVALLNDGGQEVAFIICDYLMPEKTGVELVKYVSQQERFHKLPFLMLTTENEKETVLEVIQMGATNYLLKPWTLENLADKINRCWQAKQSES